MHAERTPSGAWRFDRFTLDLARGALLGPDGVEVPVRPKSFALPRLLVENAGRLLDRDAIMAAVWPDVIVTDESITQCVRDVRRALSDEAQSLLRTIPRRGYLLTSEVSRAGPAAAVPEEAAEPRGAPEGEQGRVESEGPSAAHVAERRQLSVLFSDLVGSTRLSEWLDPEDFSEVIRVYQERCAAAVVGFGGYVVKYMGDGILAYFGYPLAYEDAAERSVRAGLAIVGAVAALEPRPDLTLQVRVGIATGLVVSDPAAGGARGEVAVGKPLNLAARLQAIAEPGTVVIAEGTRRLLGNLFALEDLGPRPLEGFAGPVRAFAVVGEGAAEGRFEALRAAGLTPLVGRERELGLLLDRWELAKEGEGQVVLLSGEAGIGKSRLVRALRERLADEPHTPLAQFCSPHHSNTALHPIFGLLERAAGLRRDEPPERQLEKLEAMLALAVADVREGAALLADLLGIPAAGRYPPLDLSPQQRKERTFRALLDQLAGLAARAPALALYEDAHWADPTTLELLGRVVERAERLPVLALVTFRPGFAPAWVGRGHVTALSLGRLGRRQGGAMVERVTGGKALPPEVMDQILARTDGVPLFIEELTKSVLESGLLAEREGRYELEGSLPPLAIPSTLQDSLTARLDRLAPAKEVAQIAACIGREFSHELIAAVAALPAPELERALVELTAAELVFSRGTAPHATYCFKHALVQDAAYLSLLKVRRQKLHAQIATVLEEQFPEAVDAQPEILAHHFTEAGSAKKAVGYWRKAGEQAAERSANVEAIAHLSKGLELIGTRPDTQAQLEEELALCLAIGGPLTATKGYSAVEVERTYSRASAICEQLGRPAELVPVLRGLWHYHLVRGELRPAHDLSLRLVALAEEQKEPLRRAMARRALGTSLFFSGQPAAATAALDEGIAIDDAIASWVDPTHLLLYTERAGVVCRLFSARALWYLGFPDRAFERLAASLALAQRLAHPYSLAFALTWAAVQHAFRREFDTAHRQSETAIGLANEHRMPLWLSQATMCRGFALVHLGQHADGIAQLRAGLADWNGIGAHLMDSQWLGFIAEAHIEAGQFDNALSALDQAIKVAESNDEFHYQAELYRLTGVVRAQTKEKSEAALWLQRAIDKAGSQQAKSLELRAARDLAQLLAHRGERNKAHDLLAPIYSWFTEGFDTPDLREAKALLDELQ